MKRLLYLIFLLTLSCQTAQLPVEPGIAKELADWRAAHISQVHYELQFRIPEQKQQPVTGSVAVAFVLDETKQDLQFDFKGEGAAVHRLAANGTELPLRWEQQHLVVDRKHLTTGKNRVEVEFTAPDQSLNRADEFLYTLFVPDRASTAFPCFDQPNLKATFALQLHVPAAWKAVANAPEAKTEQSDSVVTHYFARTEPLPTYLFAFTAGKFDTVSREHRNRRYTLYHREPDAEKQTANLDEIFRLLFLSVDSIEHYTGIPYPFAKYDLVAVPSFQYGGMEHPGVTLYRDNQLFLEGKPTPRQLLDRANLIAHETAHMWFGDLVTMPWFDEVWLKEVFANFIADKVTSPLFPEFNQQLLFLMEHNSSAYSVDRTAGANPVNQQLENLKDAGNLYGSIIYDKAPIVMSMLEDRIGKEALQRGLQQYLKNSAYGNAGWNDLIALLDTDGSLKEWSHVWVEEPGRPTLHAQAEAAGIRITQTDPATKNRFWEQPAELVWSAGGQLYRQLLKIEKPDTLIAVSPAAPIDWLYLNGNGKAYGYVAIDTTTQAWMAQNLSSVPDVLLRASAWIDLAENLAEGSMPATAFAQALMINLPAETDQVLYETLLGYLGSCVQYRLTPAEREHIQAQAEQLIRQQAALHPNEGNALSNAAMQLFRSPEGLATLEKAWLDRSLLSTPLTASQQTSLAFTLAMHLPERATEILNQQEARIDNPDLKARFRFLRPAVSADQAVRDSVFNSFTQVANRERESWVQAALSYLNHPEFSENRTAYLERGLALLPEIQQTGDIFFPQRWASSLLQGHRSAEAAAIVRQFLTSHPDFPQPLRMKVLQSADALLRKYPETPSR